MTTVQLCYDDTGRRISGVTTGREVHFKRDSAGGDGKFSFSRRNETVVFWGYGGTER